MAKLTRYWEVDPQTPGGERFMVDGEQRARMFPALLIESGGRGLVGVLCDGDGETFVAEGRRRHEVAFPVERAVRRREAVAR